MWSLYYIFNICGLFVGPWMSRELRVSRRAERYPGLRYAPDPSSLLHTYMVSYYTYLALSVSGNYCCDLKLFVLDLTLDNLIHFIIYTLCTTLTSEEIRAELPRLALTTRRVVLRRRAAGLKERYSTTGGLAIPGLPQLKTQPVPPPGIADGA